MKVSLGGQVKATIGSGIISDLDGSAEDAAFVRPVVLKTSLILTKPSARLPAVPTTPVLAGGGSKTRWFF